MGRNLFIRVSAVTYDENDVPKSWPKLYAAVWPDPGLAGVDSPAKLARKLVPARERGVLELAEAFVDYAHYGQVPEAGKKQLQAVAKTLDDLRRGLDAALGDRDAQKADGYTGKMEDALDEAEKIMREF